MKSLYNISDIIVALESLFHSINSNTNSLVTLIGGCSRSVKSYLSNYIA